MLVASATAVSPGIYNVHLVLSIPFRLAEIPGLSGVQAVTGDITLHIEIPATAQVNVPNGTVTPVRYDINGITVGE